MEVTVIFRNMAPIEALITLVKGLLDARKMAIDPTARFQLEVRKSRCDLLPSYTIQLSSGLPQRGWAAVDFEPKEAVRAAFASFDRSLAVARDPLRASAAARGGEGPWNGQLALLSR